MHFVIEGSSADLCEPFDQKALQWRHNGCDGVSNHQPHNCLLKRLFRGRSKKTSKLRVTGLCAGIHRWPVSSPHVYIYCILCIMVAVFRIRISLCCRQSAFQHPYTHFDTRTKSDPIENIQMKPHTLSHESWPVDIGYQIDHWELLLWIACYVSVCRGLTTGPLK